jgi:catechol 2,3-dioxygenase-like lactoylglutathione lyase family enzyme
MSAVMTAAGVRLQVTLNVTDLGRSVHFYRTLLAVEPGTDAGHRVRFELADPPVVLCLVPGGPVSAGSINHIGIRLPDAVALVAVQRRLEEAGIPTQRQEGVECCYARQTKFWVTDPDRNLWELYVLEEDVEVSGFEDAPPPVPAPAAVVWEHRLTEPAPGRIPRPDASVDEVRLEGSFNARAEQFPAAAMLAEVFRVLRPGGTVVVHGLVGDRAVEVPSLPGLAALVQRVPAQAELLEVLAAAGFEGLYFERLDAVPCLGCCSPDLREMRLVGRRPDVGRPGGARRVLYKGPLAQLTDEDGTIYQRGAIVEVTERACQRLRQGPAAAQFLVFPDEGPSSTTPG